jgi:predicted nucleotidyltransferase
MLSEQQIVEAVKRLAASASQSAEVIVFGSYGRGEANENSDLDLVVIEENFEDKAAEYLRLKGAVGRVGVGVDLLLFSRQEFNRRCQVRGTVPYWARKEGRVFRDTPV